MTTHAKGIAGSPRVMTRIGIHTLIRAAVVCIVGLTLVGCQRLKMARMAYESPATPNPLGTISHPIWKLQLDHADASDFVIYMHEFVNYEAKLNTSGLDHLKQIVYRLQAGQDFPIVIERSRGGTREDTQFKYRVHPNPELDLRRHDNVVQLLEAMGVDDASERVVIAPAFAQPANAAEAVQSYQQSFSGGFGGGFGGGGFGGGGFGGGFGGGGFGGGGFF